MHVYLLIRRKISASRYTYHEPEIVDIYEKMDDAATERDARNQYTRNGRKYDYSVKVKKLK